ncbi:hypothetical protein V2J09_007023 [Rumex salicifolius]
MSRFDPPTLTQQNNVQTHAEGNAPDTVHKCNKTRIVALSLRGASLLFSFLSFVIIATIKKFTTNDSYNYVFAIAMISFIYNAFQNGKGVYELVSRHELISHNKTSAFIDFIGDQAIAYMLMSGSSVGFALANEMGKLADVTTGLDELVGKTAGGAAMLFFAFLTLVFPTLFSGVKLCNTFTCSNVNLPKA